jgi:glycosyltransferase involved in cell wall biosynthesis
MSCVIRVIRVIRVPFLIFTFNMQSTQRQRMIILFAGTHLAYSPTITQLYDALAEKADVSILAETVPGFIDEKLEGRNVMYFENKGKGRIPLNKKVKYFFLRRFNRYAKKLEAAGLKLKLSYDHFLLIKNELERTKYDRVIAVDLQNMFYCSLLGIHADFISLELGIGEQLLPHIKKELIDSVIIQTALRYQYLFKDEKLRTFFIPNSPVYEERRFHADKKGLLYGGTAWDHFGFYHCLEYLEEYTDTPMTVRGALPAADRERVNKEYAELLQRKLLVIDERYLDNKDVVEYFSQFEIGICFYNFDVEAVRHFNYQSAPSGKLFKYLAAGVPVLAIDIIGFKFVEEMQCGVLIPNLEPATIRAGIEKIRSAYAFYEANTKAAAKYFSFDKALQPYLDYTDNG